MHFLKIHYEMREKMIFLENVVIKIFYQNVNSHFCENMNRNEKQNISADFWLLLAYKVQMFTVK